MNKWRVFCFWTVGWDRGKQTDPARVVRTWLLLSSVCPHWHRCWQLLTKSQNLSSKSSDISKTFFVLPCGHMTLQVLATLPPNDYRGYCSVSINAQKPSCICFCLQIYGRAHRAFIVSGCWRWVCCMSAWFPCCVCINSSWKNSDHVQQTRLCLLVWIHDLYTCMIGCLQRFSGSWLGFALTFSIKVLQELQE